MKTYFSHRNIIIAFSFFSLGLTSCDKKDDLPTIRDIDGNMYHYVTIGSQMWLVENLKTTHFLNGDPIPIVMDKDSWKVLETGAYCFYDNDSLNVSEYGYLYNWHAVNDSRGLAPSGWRIATIDDWRTLIDYLGGELISSGKLKEKGTAHWDKPNEGASNEFGFTALPGGFRDYIGNFYHQGYDGIWWSSTSYDDITAWFVRMNAETISIGIGYAGRKKEGMAIRCVKDKDNPLKK